MSVISPGKPFTIPIPRATIALIMVALLALVLRLIFIFAVSQIPVIWDASQYWDLAQQFRTHFSISASKAIFYHAGILPLVVGPLLAILPNDPRTIYTIFAILDGLVSLMVMHIVLRLKGPLWVAVLAGLIEATYIPIVIDTGSFLQQPFLRFALAVSVWSYVCVLTAQRRNIARLGMALSTIAVMIVGFSSQPTRPLMWLVPICFLIISAVRQQTRANAIEQGLLLVICAVALAFLAFTLANQWSEPVQTVVSQAFIGLSPEGTTAGQVTPVSFRYFWPPDFWSGLGFSATTSIMQDFKETPVNFLANSIWSLFSNWRYPGNVYFQAFILDFQQQKIQHILVVLVGLFGLAWLIGQPGKRQQTAILMLGIGFVVSLIYGVISVEPRRLTILIPYLAIGGAFGVWSLSRFHKHDFEKRRWLVTGGFLAMEVIVWFVPVAYILSVVPISSGLAYSLLVVLRVAVSFVCLLELIFLWKRIDTVFFWVFPLLFLGGILTLLGLVQFLDTEWRGWSSEAQTKVRQEITNLRLQEHLQPWLVMDISAPDQGRSLTIVINEQLVKSEGVPVYSWEAGLPPRWSPYQSELKTIANFTTNLRLWSAYPIPKDLLNQANLTVEIDPGHSPVSLWGDYTNSSSDDYIGPLLDPWYSGRSFWRWLWNGDDPRIPASQALNGVHYVSSNYDGTKWVSKDLSTSPGTQTGLYRIFVTQAAFGAETNAIVTPVTLMNSARGNCGTNSQNIAPSSGILLVCKYVDGTVEYSIDGNKIGSSAPDIFHRHSQQNSLVDHIDNRDLGRIDLIQISNTIFVANLYSPDSHLVYSAAFTYAS